jgi:6-phosphogluconolactonase
VRPRAGAVNNICFPLPLARIGGYEARVIETYASTAALGDACAHAVADRLKDGLRRRSRASLVGTGGRSPGPVYDALSGMDLDWERVIVTLSDERCVDPTSPDANAGQVRERLFKGRAAKAHLLPLWPAPAEAALQALAPFDAVLLGMGEDGHVASLIPGMADLEEGLTTERLLIDVEAGVGKPPVPRISMTLSALMQSRAIFLLIAGDAKRQVVARALAGEDLPVARLLRQTQVPVRVFCAPQH